MHESRKTSEPRFVAWCPLQKLSAIAAGGLLMLATLESLVAAEAALPAMPATGTAPPLPANTNTSAAAPRIQFAEPIFDFGRVPEGDVIRHEFIFTNTGNATLLVTDVHPSCHCTVPGDWSREVAPGATGKIALEFNSTRFVGPVFKETDIVCNDPAQPQMRLYLKGTVWKPIDFNPSALVLNVTADSTSNVSSIVKITSNLDEPLKLSNPTSNNPSFIAELQAIQDGKEYQLKVTAVAPLTPGTVQGVISLQTSWTNKPVVTVPVFAVVQQPLVVVPSQILLPATHPPAYAVSIRNNSGSPVTVSNPQINVPGIDLNLKEVEPGRQFTVTLTFRPEFSLAPGQQAELSLNTSHPRYATIKVPVRQYLPPAAATSVVRPITPASDPRLNPATTPPR